MKQRKHALIQLSVVMLLAVSLLLTACGGTATPTTVAETTLSTAAAESTEATTAAPENKHNDTLRLPAMTTFISTDPHYSAQNSDYALYVSLYESFYYVDSQQNVEPRLATSYDVSADGLIYTYHLKPDVKWQTGGTLKASDVVYSIHRAQESPYTQSYLAMVKDVKAVDDLTVEFTLAGVSPTFYIDVNRVMFLSEEATKDLEPSFTNQIPGGTGPYQLVSWVPDQKVVISRNPDYHGNPAPIGTIITDVFGDSNAALRAFEAGELDWINVPAADWDRVQANGKYKTFLQDTISTYFFTMNNQKAPFDDQKVRQAFNYAVNKQDMLDAALEGTGRVSSTLGNSELVFGLPKEGEIFVYNYDPEKAKQLLSEAGYANGLTLEDPILIMASDDFSIPAQILQEQLAAIGVKAEIQTVEQSAYISDVISGNYSIGIMALSLDIDASIFSMAYTTSGIDALNLARYSNARVDELFAQAAATLDQKARKAAYTEAFDIASKEAAYLPLYCLQAAIASDKDLTSNIYATYYSWSWN